MVGGTLWIFNERRATKLPLSWLDIDATTTANETAGLISGYPTNPVLPWGTRMHQPERSCPH